MAKRKPLRNYRRPKRIITSDWHENGHYYAELPRLPSLLGEPSLHPQQPQSRKCLDESHPNLPLDHNGLTDPEPTLANRFHALPTELRAYIFAFLLVRPLKWDLPHQPECPLRTSNASITPCIPYSYWHSPAYCSTNCPPTRWRRSLAVTGTDIWTSPWRSQWAPAPLNPYVCTRCYDERLRPQPHPSPPSLPCLCARRQDLGLFLVCRQWRDEAGGVFYSRNTFAFEDPTTFRLFIHNVEPRWKSLISRVSIMVPDHERFLGSRSYRRDTRLSLRTLRELTALTYLELDACHLQHVESVNAMLRFGLRNLRQFCFVQNAAERRTKQKQRMGSEMIWPTRAGRTLLKGAFAEEVARAAKGQRQERLRGTRGKVAIAEAVAAARGDIR